MSNLPGMKDDEIVSVLLEFMKISISKISLFFKFLHDLQLKLFGADEKEIKNYNEMKEMHETCKKALEIMCKCTSTVDETTSDTMSFPIHS